MTIFIEVLENTLVALLQLKQGQRAVLIGICDTSRTVVLSGAFCTADDIAATRDEVNSLLPAPLQVIGACCSKQCDLASLRNSLWPGGLAAVVYENGLHVHPGDNTSSSLTATVQPEQPDGVPDVLHSAFVPLRCTADLMLEVVSPGTSAAASGSAPASPLRGQTPGGRLDEHAMHSAFDELEQEVCGPSTIFIADTPAAGGDSSAARMFMPDDTPLAALGATWDAPVHLRPYCRAEGAASLSAPSMVFDPIKGAMACAALRLDVLCYAPKDMPAQLAVQEVLFPAVRAQLRVMRREVERRGEVTPFTALHFQPPKLPHHITLVYPLPTSSIESDEEPLLPLRFHLHSLLGLPTNRPLLRVANAVEFGATGRAASSAAGAGGGGVGGKPRLADVHLGVAPSSVGGSVHLVQGSYDYHHYMQDKFDDSGWGCAYRSLQTICSWFVKQLYTSKPVPSHRQIQQTLVSIGDKQQEFIGSRQWIGAIELGFVLDTLLGVTCKVITVASGADMPSKAREIAHHFDTQGTPIMIGGGVLAYTLLGIDFNERTGECAFLILDPHYTGAEDKKRIQSGQWIAWKKMGDKAAAGGELFVKDAFYNLLCPQCPHTV